MSNLWEQFKGILPDKPKLYCTVFSASSGGETVVSTLSGGSMKVLGTGYTAGQKVWVQDGRIIADAPNLTHYDIEV